MRINYFLGGYDNNFSYLIWCPITLKAALIDASVEISKIIDYINNNKLKLEKILITHTHFDHIKFLDDITNIYSNIQIYGHNKSENLLKTNYKGLHHNEIISLGLEIITILHTPGHYPDSVCFWNKNNDSLFTGDTIFVGRTGRTIDKKSNISQLYNSVYKIILQLPKNTIIYPGHHYGYKKNISLKENVSLYPFFQCQSENEFINIMDKYEKNR